MENINYTKFSEEEFKDETPVVEGPIIEDEVIEEEKAEEPKIEEVIEPAPPVEEKKDVIGVVNNCVKLNVRKGPSPTAAVLKVIDAGARVKIDEENSTNNFYKVQVAGITGFCMKEFIAVE